MRNLQRKEQNSRKARHTCTYRLSLCIVLARVSVAPVLFVEFSNIFNILNIFNIFNSRPFVAFLHFSISLDYVSGA